MKNDGLEGFQKYLHPCDLDESSLSIGRVKRGVSLLGPTSGMKKW